MLLSQLNLLKQSLAKLEPEFGADNPFVQGLRAQIAMHEKPRADNPMGLGRPLDVALSAGMRAESDSPASGEPPETEADGINAEALRRAKVRRLSKGSASHSSGDPK
jgi:hypothetical protein